MSPQRSAYTLSLMNRLAAFFLLCFTLLLAACANVRDLDHAPAETQRIHLWHSKSGEEIDVVYREGGRYIAASISEIDYLFRDRHTGEVYPVDPALIDLIADLRDRMIMAPDTRIELLSGYRSPESNRELAKTNKYVARGSYHMKAQAADIRIPDMNSSALELVAKTIQRGGVALYPDSRHVHVDTGPIRGWSVVRGSESGTAASAHDHYHGRTKALQPDTTQVVPIKPIKGTMLPAPGKVRPVFSKTGQEPRAPTKKKFAPTLQKGTLQGKGKASGKNQPVKAPARASGKLPAKPAARPATKPAAKKPTTKPAAKAKKH